MTDGYNRLHRHIETVRNYIGACIRELMARQEQHDQSKLEEPELSAYLSMAHIRNLPYRSAEYESELKKIDYALKHHYSKNSDHPEFHQRGFRDMTLIDLVELLADWKSATLRTPETSDILKSIEINQERYGYGEELKDVLINTAKWLNEQKVFHKADES